MLLGHLGDGLLAVLDCDGGVAACSAPQRRSSPACGTYFVVSPDACDRLRLTLISRERADFLVMMSDGPYEMFCNRAKGNPLPAVQELRQNYKYHDDAGLGAALNQMTTAAYQRMDDWAVLTWNSSGSQWSATGVPEVVSMLREEERKISHPCQN
jgi:hypothetical protein